MQLSICAIATVILVFPIVITYQWIRRKLQYWERRQVAAESLPEIYKFRGRQHVAYAIQRIYQKSKSENRSYAAAYQLISPALIISDLDLIKQVLITDFESFPDRGMYSNYKQDPLSRNLVRLQGGMWRKVRAKLTPTFTSGKIKQMFGTIIDIGQRFIDVMQQNALEHNHLVEIKDLCARFTTDVIGSVAFGLDCNSLQQPDTEFRRKGDKAFHTIHPLGELLASRYRKFFNALGYRVFTKDLIEFYSRIVRQTVEYRERHNVKRNDFLDLLIELKNSPAEEGEFSLSMEDVIAQAFVFFIGGFETSSSTMTFTLFEMAHNPVVQEKARQDVRTTLEKHNGKFTYESLNEMQYIRQVVQETLRKYPVAPTGRRICRRSCTLPGPQPLTIDPGVYVIIPVYAIHHDPAIYPQPEVYRPERFSAEEKNERHPMAYQPFGAGPRSCIAERFGMLQSMMGVALLLHNFRFSKCAQTPERLEFDPFNIRVLNSIEGIHLKVEKM
uniref:Cytochrome P450 n=1 Tax=Stomoxys calcitrans TaxID=35570 RepID=A0A1I8NQM9_STOCA